MKKLGLAEPRAVGAELAPEVLEGMRLRGEGEGRGMSHRHLKGHFV